MPLRVAEKDGYIKAVNECYICPFINLMNFRCEHENGKSDIGLEYYHERIPVWCPLPEPTMECKNESCWE